MWGVFATAGALRRTQLLRAYNRSSGYRWSPIPKPPPPHYDRLYGVHAVLNTLRVAAAQQQKRQAPSSSSLPTVQTECEQKDGSGGKPDVKGSQDALPPTEAAPDVHVAGCSSLHPHRSHLSCLYVRDFSAEEEGRDRSASKRRMSDRGEKKVIPLRYTAVRCIAALAKSLDVQVRFVPRAELVQLCGERRHQNVVLEASSYATHAIQRLEHIWIPGTDGAVNGDVKGGGNNGGALVVTSSPPLAPPHRELILFLEHIIDPANIGGILRTSFFFGVDHVVLSRDCAACTAAVSRASAGFLEHIRVHRATVPTAEFLQASLHGDGRLEDVIASAVVSGEPAQASAQQPLSPCTAEVTGATAGDTKDTARSDCCTLYPRKVRLLLLGNEDAGLPAELLQWCSHVAHVRSPRQLRLQQARSREGRGGGMAPPPYPEANLYRSTEGDSDGDAGHGRVAASVGTPHHALSEVEKREHNLQRLTRLRGKEVSLNVNTATAALLTALAAVEGDLPRRASFGMVDVQALRIAT